MPTSTVCSSRRFIRSGARSTSRARCPDGSASRRPATSRPNRGRARRLRGVRPRTGERRMSNRFDAAGAQAWRARLGWALAALLSGWTVAAGDAQAERFVLSSGETVEGTIVAATRNTVVVRRSIGGMRQMATEDIAEVRFDLVEGRLAGEFLRWADGVYELGVGDEVVRLGEGGIVSRAPRQAAAPRREFPSAPEGQQQIGAAQSHSPEEAAVLAAEDPADVANLAVSGAAAGGTGDREAGAWIGAVAERAAGANTATGDESAAASEEASRAGDAGGLTIKASVGPPAPGERSMVFKIELSEPAAQSVMLIYGT